MDEYQIRLEAVQFRINAKYAKLEALRKELRIKSRALYDLEDEIKLIKILRDKIKEQNGQLSTQ